jgi:hypothetical protein
VLSSSGTNVFDAGGYAAKSKLSWLPPRHPTMGVGLTRMVILAGARARVQPEPLISSAGMSIALGGSYERNQRVRVCRVFY